MNSNHKRNCSKNFRCLINNLLNQNVYIKNKMKSQGCRCEIVGTDSIMSICHIIFNLPKINKESHLKCSKMITSSHCTGLLSKR